MISTSDPHMEETSSLARKATWGCHVLWLADAAIWRDPVEVGNGPAGALYSRLEHGRVDLAGADGVDADLMGGVDAHQAQIRAVR